VPWSLQLEHALQVKGFVAELEPAFNADEPAFNAQKKIWQKKVGLPPTAFQGAALLLNETPRQPRGIPSSQGGVVWQSGKDFD
jgi:hypothetical protein